MVGSLIVSVAISICKLVRVSPFGKEAIVKRVCLMYVFFVQTKVQTKSFSGLSCVGITL